jgi:hypothetical protein
MRKLDAANRKADIVQTSRDTNPAVLKAKDEAILKWLNDNGFSHQRFGMEEYDRIRTLLQHHIQRGKRAEAIAEEARRMPGDFEENFLQLREIKTDNDAVETLQWMMLQNPGMTPDQAVRQMELAWMRDGILRPPQKQITVTDQRVLGQYFEAKTNARLNNQREVIAALGDADTKPNFEDKNLFKREMIRKGEWAPRTAGQIDDSRPAWSLEEEWQYFMSRYGEAPAWTTDGRLYRQPGQVVGEAFMDREAYYRVHLETGNYDETLRMRRALGEEQYSDFDALAFGVKGPDGNWLVKPAKDIAKERLWVVQRYGDEVGQVMPDGEVHLTAMPWLMNQAEMVEYRRLIGGAEVGDGIISNADELAEVHELGAKLAKKYLKLYVRGTGLLDDGAGAASVTISSADIHRMTFDIMREMATTQAWRKFRTKLRNRNLLDAWGWFWRAVIVSNPAFVVSNIIDTPTKALWFSVTDRFARRSSEQAVKDIPDYHALGIEGTAFFFNPNARTIVDRLGRTTSYGNMDRAGALADLATNALSRNTLQPVERAVKTKLARQILTGLYEEVAPRMRAEGIADNVIKEFLILETRGRIMKLFPTLDNAGLAERMLNKLMPFISYNFKNKMLWMGEIVEHPWIIPVVQQMQGALIAYNTQRWEKQYPGYPVPEHLMHQINIPGTEIFIDLGMFTDSARGGAPIFAGPGNNVGAFIGTFIRPLPAQRAFVENALFHMFGAFGRQRWVRVIGEDGFATGEWEMVEVPPGTP